LTVLHDAWPILALLLVALVTSVLGVLGSYHVNAIRTHDLVRESKRRRLEYEKALMEHRRGLDAEA
jgi:hypothetical protein